MNNLSNEELATMYVELQAQEQHAKAEKEKIKELLLDRTDFETVDLGGITIKRQSKKTIKFIDGVDMKSLWERYPEIVKRKEVFNPQGIPDIAMQYLRVQYPEVVVEEFEGDAKLIHQLEPGKNTEQTVSTFIKVEGMGKAI